MSKRSGEALDQEKTLKSNDAALPSSNNGNDQPANDLEMGEFEDPYGDDFESEGEIVEIDSAGENDDVDMDQESRPIDQSVVEDKSGEIYLPHRSRPLGPDEVLEADPSVYEMLHNVHMPWPCLTLDILPDNLGTERRSYPATMYVATATQAEKSRNNELIMMKLSSLAKTLVKNEDEDDDDEDDESYDVDPVLESETIPLKDTTNRLRVSPHARTTGEYFAATMNESGEANIFDLSPQFKAFDSPGYMIPKTARRALHTIKSHGNVEGYGLDWSPLISTGALLTGDVSGRVYFTQRTSGSKWVTEKTAFQGSEASIEEIQWSPNEKTVFATGDCDGFIRIWDTRSKKHKPAINVQASSSDVNVLSWCNKIDYLLASGHDDGSWGVWDLRNFKNKENISPVVNYDFHKSPITSISFNPLDESIVAVSSEDNTVTLWDLAVEADDEEIQQEKTKYKEMQEIPPQLLFVHWQKEVKDVRWHPQIPGALVSTGTDGLNVWKTISV